MKTVNSKEKYLIDCHDNQYRIGNITGTVPKDHDCILDGWHLKNGKIIREGKAIFVPGSGDFKLTNSIIESADEVHLRFGRIVSIVDNIFLCPKGIFVAIN